MKKIPAYLQTNEFETVWKLALNMAGVDDEAIDQDHLPETVRDSLFAIISAITWHKISVRTCSRLILEDDSITSFFTDICHHLRIGRTLRQAVIDKNYYDSLYVKRPEVIAWCEKDYLPIPPKWANSYPAMQIVAKPAGEDDQDTGWYAQLTDNRKDRVTCLRIAKRLWEENPQQTYDEIYKHPVMVKYGNPRVFTFEAFKKWARPYASEYATNGGRKPKIKQL